MGFLLLAVACSLGIATLFKLAERRDLDRMALLTVNYAVAAVLALGLQGGSLTGIPRGVVVLGTGQGVLFIGGFWLFSLAIREAGMGLAAAAMRLSIALPVAASWAIWGEAPTLVQGAGMGLAGIAFALLSRPHTAVVPEAASEAASTEAPRRSAAALLLVLFVTGGLVDVGMKTFQVEYSPSVPPATFLLFVFSVAFGLGASAVAVTGVRTGRWPRASVLGWGAGLGVLNYASSDLFLRALGALPAPVAFPLNSVGIVLGAAVLGRIAWGERFSRIHLIGLALATLAVALLAG